MSGILESEGALVDPRLNLPLMNSYYALRPSIDPGQNTRYTQTADVRLSPRNLVRWMKVLIMSCCRIPNSSCQIGRQTREQIRSLGEHRTPSIQISAQLSRDRKPKNVPDEFDLVHPQKSSLTHLSGCGMRPRTSQIPGERRRCRCGLDSFRWESILSHERRNRRKALKTGYLSWHSLKTEASDCIPM